MKKAHPRLRGLVFDSFTLRFEGVNELLTVGGEKLTVNSFYLLAYETMSREKTIV